MASMKATVAYGLNYVFYQIPYSGTAVTFSVDPSATIVNTVWPASGPTVSIGTTVTSGLKTVTIAAGGADSGGNVIICASHGKTISSSKP